MRRLSAQLAGARASVLVIKKLGDELLPQLMETVLFLKVRRAPHGRAAATLGRCAAPQLRPGMLRIDQRAPRRRRPQEHGMRPFVEKAVFDRLSLEEGFGFVETFMEAHNPASACPPALLPRARCRPHR